MSKPSLKVTSDFQDEFNRVIETFKNDNVLVGIPETTTDRKNDDEDEGPITNAAILAINEYGSPANNIPPRPVLAIGIARAMPDIEFEFKRMAKKVLDGGLDALFQGYERIGIIAANSVKKVINSQDGIDGPSAETILSRKARGFKGTKALVVTSQMRNAITSVVRRKL